MGKIASLRHQPSPLWTPGRLALLSVLLAALALRLYGLNWDQGQYLHPDERYVIQYVMQGRIHFDWPPDLPTLLNPETSGLNPRSDDPATGHYREFAYGALPLLVTDGAAEVLTWLTDRDWHASDRVYLLGRTFSALLDALTVAIVYLIGRTAFSARVGLFAAALAALAPMSIQLAHFLTTDSWLTFFVALCLLFSINAGDTGLHRWFAAAGAGFGLAMATKGSVFTLAAIIVAAVVVDVIRRRQLGGSWISSGAAGIERLALAGVCSIVAFGAFEPFALIAPEPFLRSLETQANIVRGVFDVPFTRQYVGTTPVIYQLEQLIRWGFGPAAGILMLAGLPIAAWRLWKRPNAGTVLVLGWIAIYSMVIAIPETKFLRYLAPLVPVLAVVGGVALEAGWRFIARRWNFRLATGITAATLCCAALWTAAFSSVYAGENPRIAASRWIFANIPNGSALSGELWDDGLPKEFGPGLTASDRQFESVGFDMYRDYSNQSDLTVLGETLARESLTYPVSQALVEGSYKQARDVLIGISSVLGDLPQTNRDQLALLLERAANQISGSAALR
ncbi:MAG: glycosyltransferase family 39 protein, partial [Chloroflexia bacterium]|nr:glycosyltransferase family 39 protein [Chloroflexia bacterium]